MPDTPVCSNCQYGLPEDGYLNTLCSSCRKQLSRYPVTGWVWWLAAGVGALFVVSLFNLPKVITANIDYKRANRLMLEKKYISAENAFRKLTATYPKDFKSAAKLAIAAYHNNHFGLMAEVMQKWEGKHVEEQDLVTEVNNLNNTSAFYVLQDTALQHRVDSAADRQERIVVLKAYHLSHLADVAATYQLAWEYFEDEQYKAAVALCEEVKLSTPDAVMFYPLLAAAYKELGEFGKAMAVCGEALAINAESVSVLAAKAQILLRQRNDKAALSVAQAAHALDPQQQDAMLAVAMAAHFNRADFLHNQMTAKLVSIADSSAVMAINALIEKETAFRN